MSLAQGRVDLSRAKKDLANSQRAFPYNAVSEMLAAKKVTSLEEGIKFVETVLAERF